MSKAKKVGRVKTKVIEPVIGAVIAKLDKFDGKLPSASHKQVWDRPGWVAYLIRGDDEKTINELNQSGRTIGTIRYEGATPSDSDDEVIIVVRK